jgi:hypothetical protein
VNPASSPPDASQAAWAFGFVLVELGHGLVVQSLGSLSLPGGLALLAVLNRLLNPC